MREAASFIARQSDASSILENLVQMAWRAASALNNRRKVRSLVELDDHILSDLGLTRGDVAAALDVPFVHDPSLELQRLALHNRRRGWRV